MNGGVGGGWTAAKTVTSWPPVGTACADVLGMRGVSAPQSTWDGAGEGWEMAAVGLHPVPLTQPRDSQPVGAGGSGYPCPARAGRSPQAGRAVLGAPVAPHPGCQVPTAPCAPPKCCTPACHGHPWQRESGGGSALAGSPQVSHPRPGTSRSGGSTFPVCPAEHYPSCLAPIWPRSPARALPRCPAPRAGCGRGH